MQYNKLKNRTILFLSVLLAILISSCSSTRRTETHKRNAENHDRDSIMFMVFKISNDSVQGKNVIELVSKTKSSGKMKSDALARTDFEDYLTVEVFEQNKRTNVIVVEHPLRKHVEYIDDGGRLAMKYVELNHAEFFIRFQIAGNTNKIRILETLKNAEKRELKIFKL